MIVDRGRMDAYVRALRQAIKPGAVVVDLGCGPGLFALIACQLGARRVFAIEPNDVIQVGRDAAREHGFGDRIEFIQELSTKVSLPEQAEVIVSDLRGVLPWFANHLPSIIDARSRFLAPNGILIPARDTLWAAIVEVPDYYEGLVKPWDGPLTLSYGRRLAVNNWSKLRVTPESLLGQPVCWYRLDYYRVEEVNFSKDVSLSAARAGMAHGLIIWFDAELFDGVGFSNGPDHEALIYKNAFFPFEQPIEVRAGDRIDVHLDGRLIGDDYVWSWNTTVSSTGKTFKQSTLLGIPLSQEQLRKGANR
jgi:type I protein arginine methyltransferase